MKFLEVSNDFLKIKNKIKKSPLTSLINHTCYLASLMEADALPVHLHCVCDGHFIFLQFHRNQMTLKGTTYHMHHNFPLYWA